MKAKKISLINGLIFLVLVGHEEDFGENKKKCYSHYDCFSEWNPLYYR